MKGLRCASVLAAWLLLVALLGFLPSIAGSRVDLSSDPISIILNPAGGEGDQCASSDECEYPFMCCGCSRHGDLTKGRCLSPHHDQCNWEMGCLTDDYQCGCAWSKCEPYHSLPCHNARESYTCRTYEESEHMQRCGY